MHFMGQMVTKALIKVWIERPGWMDGDGMGEESQTMIGIEAGSSEGGTRGIPLWYY